MKPLDSMDLVTFIVGYQKLWNCTTAKLTIKGDKQEPLAPLTDHGKDDQFCTPKHMHTYD